MNVPAVNDLQQKLSAVMEELDHKVFRPQQVRSRRPPSAPTMAPRAIDRAGSTSLTVPTPRSRPPPLARARKPRSCVRRSART